MVSTLDKIYRASMKFLAPLTLEETFQAVIEESVRFTGAKYGSIFLEKEGQLERIYASDPFLYNSLPQKGGYVSLCFSKQKAFMVTSRKLWKIHPEYKKHNVHAVVFIPLVYAIRPIGVLTIYLLESKDISPTQMKVLKLYGLMVSSAIRKAQLYGETWQAIEEKNIYKNLENTLESIYKSGLKLLVPLGTKETYETIVKEAISLVGAGNGSIFLSQDNNLKRVYASSPLLYNVKPRRGGVTYSAFEKGVPIVIHTDQLDEVKAAHPTLKKVAPGSIIFIPLVHEGEQLGILTVQSLKDRRFSERELRILALFGALASLAIRKTQLYSQAKDAIDARDLFISMAAHELRTPLTALNGYVQLMYRKLSGTTSPEAKWATGLKWETTRLSRLINDLLAVDSIKRGELAYQFEASDLGSIVEQAISEFAFSYPKHRVVLHPIPKKEEARVLADTSKLVQLFVNILNNAGKFTPPDKKISVSIKADADTYTVCVQDQGIGIKKEELEQVFERFFKGNSNYEEGVGLGLFIAREIVRRHKGEISIQSKAGRGTQVTISLPKYDNAE